MLNDMAFNLIFYEYICIIYVDQNLQNSEYLFIILILYDV